MTTKKVTIRDVASAVGVSSATVSIALSGKNDSSRVSREVVEKVVAAAKALNYRPNKMASNLRTGRSHTLGVIVSDITNDFVSQLTKAIQDRAESKGYLTIIANSNENVERTKSIIDSMLNIQIDGLIIVPSEGSESVISRLVEEKFPTMLLDRYYPDIKSNFVVIDNFCAAQNLAKSLLDKGCKRVAYIGYDVTLSTAIERRCGFCDVMRSANVLEQVAQFEVSYSNIKEDIKKIINVITGDDLKVDGICCATNSIAYYTIKELIKLGLRVPEDIHLASFDNNDFYEIADLTISYVQQPIAELAKQAVDGLINTIENDDEDVVGHKIQATVVER